MKRVTLIPSIIALAVLLCAPFSLTPVSGSTQHGGLVCYCCTGQGIPCACTLVSCPKCNTPADVQDTDWSPDLIYPSFEMTIHFQPVVSRAERFYSPRQVYPNVPVKPPNTP
ncbi:MAG: hypothetical protein HY879_02065 [Deltaproteobacteria bacterium]|nr:hypothetical protein [Deltaproteobacteria bacterium]